MKLNQKIILIAILPLFISTSVSTIIITEHTNDELFNSTILHIKSLCELTENEMRNPMNNLDIDKLNEIIDHLEEQKGILQVSVFFPDGRLLTDGSDSDFNYGLILEDEFIQRAIISNIELMQINDNEIRLSKPIILNEKIGILVLDYSTKNINIVIQNSITDNIGYTIILIGISSVIATYLSRSISNPILKIKKHVEDISKGKFRIEYIKSDISELDKLSKTI